MHGNLLEYFGLAHRYYALAYFVADGVIAEMGGRVAGVIHISGPVAVALALNLRQLT